MREEATSEKNEVSWKVSEAEVQVMNEKTSAFVETTSSMQGSPLGGRVPGVPMTGCLAVEQDNSPRPIARIQNVDPSEVLCLLHRNGPKILVFFCCSFIEDVQNPVEPARRDPELGERLH